MKMLQNLKKIFQTRKNNKMRLSHIIEQVYLRPMMITETSHASIRAVIENKLAGHKLEDMGDMFGDAPKPYDMAEGIRVIPISGPIGYKVSGIEKACGGVADVLEIKQWVKEANADEAVETIVFDIDSGGGSVTGVFELSRFISESPKLTIGFTDGMACSAAYAIMAGCNELYATPSSDVASIGVYSYVHDVSKRYEAEGIEVNVFKSGKLKGIGIEGISMTDEQKAHMQAEVDDLGTIFRAWVTERRGDIPQTAMEGQSIMSNKAIGLGLLDGLVDDMESIFFHD
jgi:ClpP class serine protease